MTPSNEKIARIDELVQQVDALIDPHARAAAVDLVQAVMDLHAAALDRMLEIIAASAPTAAGTLAADDLVSSVLVLHGLHPDDFSTRFARAIDKLERHFDSRGGRIEVLEGSPERVHLRFTGKRPGSGAAARQTIEDVLFEVVPEIGELVVDGTAEEQPGGFVPLASLLPLEQAAK